MIMPHVTSQTKLSGGMYIYISEMSKGIKIFVGIFLVKILQNIPQPKQDN